MFYALDIETGKAIWSLDLIAQSSLPEIELVSTPTVIVDRDGLKEHRRLLFGVGLRGGLSAPAKLYCVLESTNHDPE